MLLSYESWESPHMHDACTLLLQAIDQKLVEIIRALIFFDLVQLEGCPSLRVVRYNQLFFPYVAHIIYLIA